MMYVFLLPDTAKWPQFERPFMTRILDAFDRNIRRGTGREVVRIGET